MPVQAGRVVHLELHTRDLPRSRAFYSELCGWGTQLLHTRSRSYTALELGGDISGGIVECGTRRPLWVPYVEVAEIGEATSRALRLGASVLLEPREGPAGWRSVITTREGGELALWQPKTCVDDAEEVVR